LNLHARARSGSFMLRWAGKVLLLMCAGMPLWCGTAPADTGTAEPIRITAQRLELDHPAGKVTFSGSVRAEQGDVVILCSEMQVLYESAREGTIPGPEAISEILASGGAVIRQGDREVRGERARFFQKEQKVVVTGNPMLTEGPQTVQGATITFFLDRRRFVVDGGKETPVRALLFPGKGQ